MGQEGGLSSVELPLTSSLGALSVMDTLRLFRLLSQIGIILLTWI